MSDKNKTHISDVKPRSADLLAQMGHGELYRRAYDKKQSLSWFLEENDPSEEYNDGLDAFERLLKTAEIVTTSDHARGYYADQFQKFDTNDNTRALVPEFINRVWRRVAEARPVSTRNVYTSHGSVPVAVGLAGDTAGNLEVRGPSLAPAVPINTVIARTTPIDRDSYTAYYMSNNDLPEDQLRLVRIAEGAEMPRVKLAGGQHSIRLRKFGRVIEVTYESLRRLPIDVVAFHVARIAVQAERDRVAAALNVMINGDGNPGTAAETVSLTSLDPAAPAGTLTLPAWLAFKMRFKNPYFPTTVLVNEDAALQLMLLNVGNANIPLASLPAAAGNMALTPINPALREGLALGWLDEVPANAIVAFDNRLAVERIVEIGSDISEVERWTTRQTQTLTLSENDGFAVIDSAATKILLLNV